MDNLSTRYFQTQKKLSLEQARCKYFLAKFNYELEYKLGKSNIVVDALCRKGTLALITQVQSFFQDKIKQGLKHDPLAKNLIAMDREGKTQNLA